MWRIMGVGRVIFWVALAMGGYYAYLQFGSFTSSDSQLRQSMAPPLCAVAARNVPLPDERIRLVVGRCHGDVDTIVTNELRQALARRNVVVVDATPWDIFSPMFVWPAVDLSLEENIALAKSHQVPYLIFSTVEHWSIAPGEERRLTIRVALVDVLQGVILYSHSFTQGPKQQTTAAATVNARSHHETAAAPTLLAEQSSPETPSFQLLTFGVWVVICLLTPWLGQDYIVTALRSQSNSTSATLILGYLLVVITTGWFTWADFDSKWLTATLLFGVALPWLSYFEFVCRSVAYRLET